MVISETNEAFVIQNLKINFHGREASDGKVTIYKNEMRFRIENRIYLAIRASSEFFDFIDLAKCNPWITSHTDCRMPLSEGIEIPLFNQIKILDVIKSHPVYQFLFIQDKNLKNEVIQNILTNEKLASFHDWILEKYPHYCINLDVFSLFLLENPEKYRRIYANGLIKTLNNMSEAEIEESNIKVSIETVQYLIDLIENGQFRTNYVLFQCLCKYIFSEDQLQYLNKHKLFLKNKHNHYKNSITRSLIDKRKESS